MMDAQSKLTVIEFALGTYERTIVQEGRSEEDKAKALEIMLDTIRSTINEK